VELPLPTPHKHRGPYFRRRAVTASGCGLGKSAVLLPGNSSGVPRYLPRAAFQPDLLSNVAHLPAGLRTQAK